MTYDEASMEQIARDYFQMLYTTNGIEVMKQLLDGVTRCVSDNSNRMHLNHYSE